MYHVHFSFVHLSESKKNIKLEVGNLFGIREPWNLYSQFQIVFSCHRL